MTGRKRNIIIAAVFAVLLAGGIGAGALLGGGSGHPSTQAGQKTTVSTVPATPKQALVPYPSPTVSVTIAPDPALALPKAKSYQSDGWATVGTQLTVAYPKQWHLLISPDGGDDTKLNFSDNSRCPEDESACPPVMFQDLTNQQGDPIAKWAEQACPGGTPSGKQGPISFKMAGADAKFYSYPCDGVDNFAWIAPGQILVMASDNNGYAVDPDLVQGVLDKATWR